jgi:hypothetical protein
MEAIGPHLVWGKALFPLGLALFRIVHPQVMPATMVLKRHLDVVKNWLRKLHVFSKDRGAIYQELGEAWS